ncbi:short chain dehydrogenase [Stagonosporopsis vannaccii]|nr:short chain dehydrogenase [Stagonosporopsis vannaccii]
MASSTTIFITGANTGLGLYTVKALYKSPEVYTILLGSRDLSKAAAAIEEVKREHAGSASTIEPIQIDLEDDNSITQAYEAISKKHDKIDVLINNAGAQFDQQVPQGKMTTREMWNQSWNVNVTGTYILTRIFVPLLLSSSQPRLLFITSGTSTLMEHDNLALSINRSPAAGWPKQEFAVTAYRSTKTGMNMMVLEWHRMLKEDGVKVFAISPGMLATGLGGNPELMKKMGALDPTIGAELIRDVVEGRRDEDVGKVVRRNDVQPW